MIAFKIQLEIYKYFFANSFFEIVSETFLGLIYF